MMETVSIRLKSFRKIITAITAICCALGIVCLAMPTFTKRVQLSALGDQTISETAEFSMALSHFAGSELSRLASQPKADSFSKELSTLMSNVADRNGYDNKFLLAFSAQAGIEYTFWFPLQLSVDLRPSYGILGGEFYKRGRIGFTPSLSARYRF